VINRDLFSLLIAICLTIMSVIGTLGWLQVQHAQKMTLATQNSVGFQSLQAQITTLQTQVEQLQATAHSLPANYYTRRQHLLQQARTLEQQKLALTQQLASYSPQTGLASNALYVALGRFFQQAPGLIELWINTTSGILLELVAVMAGVYLFRSEGEYTVPVPNVTNLKPVKDLTDQTSSTWILPAYIEGLFTRTQKKPAGTQLRGRWSIAEEKGFSKKEAESCHNYLKQKGLITVKGNATFTNLSQAEMMAAIGEEAPA